MWQADITIRLAKSLSHTSRAYPDYIYVLYSIMPTSINKFKNKTSLSRILFVWRVVRSKVTFPEINKIFKIYLKGRNFNSKKQSL